MLNRKGILGDGLVVLSIGHRHETTDRSGGQRAGNAIRAVDA